MDRAKNGPRHGYISLTIKTLRVYLGLTTEAYLDLTIAYIGPLEEILVQ